jgi:hypothetical protein
MRVTCEAFWLQKDGLTADEYEDAFSYYPQDSHITEHNRFRCTVTDGATETSFSALWAQLLSEDYCKNGELDLPKLQHIWSESVAQRKLAWYAEAKAKSGAFAALVGLTLTPPPADHYHPGLWQSWALGDSCLFHVRDETILQATPLDRWEQFNNSPFLLSSNADQNSTAASKAVIATGTWHSGDVFYLMTDAISCWFLRRQDEQGDAVKLITNIVDQESLSTLAKEQRTKLDQNGHRLMRNDDITIMRVRPLAAVIKHRPE